MLKVRSFIKLDTPLSTDNGDIDNWINYIEYLNDIIYKLVKDLDKNCVYNSNIFGTVKYIIYTDEAINDRDGKYIIQYNLIDERENAEELENDWYEKLELDKDFLDNIISNTKEYIIDINNAIKQIQYPINENLIYKNEHLYMEISPINSKHTPEFVPLAVDDDINIEDFLDNTYAR